ncbi:uncharacterized protein LOC135468386 isoform X2 [Liolophura sinensis]|uniref:uncharacterized protein LOC135468386 isoform X2 n=1 Tax=Liolophura sinensis TaxID=3198878 RepID=UPI0031587EB2
MHRPSQATARATSSSVQLLKIQSALQVRKTTLQRMTKQFQFTETEQAKENSADEETNHLFQKIYPILKAIHREEVQALELRRQHELVSVNTEKELIRHSLKQVCERCGGEETTSGPNRSKVLTSWVHELQQLLTESDSSGYSVFDLKFSLGSGEGTKGSTDAVSFGVSVQSFAVWVCIKVVPNSLPCELKVSSDPYIPGVEEDVQQAHIHQRPVHTILSFISSIVMSDILPFL